MIYADYNGSAPISNTIKEYINTRLIEGPFANPNSIHNLGAEIANAMENARKYCANALDARADQLIFTSGATEGISTIFQSVLKATDPSEKPYIVLSGVEHSAVYNNAKYYEENGYKIIYIKTTSDGVIDMNDFSQIVSEKSKSIALVATIAASNETGVIQPYTEIAAICNKNSILNFTDTTQLIGKHNYSFKDSNADFAVMSGHKIGAMTGTGLIMAKDKKNIRPLIIGAGQENGLRGGTQHYLGHETLAIALHESNSKIESLQELKSKKIEFEKEIKNRFPQVVIVGENSERLANTTYISFPGIHGQAVQIEMESEDIFISTSSACSDNEPVTSKVLKSMNISDDIGRGAVRITPASPNDYEVILDSLTKTYTKLKKIKSY